MIPVGRWHVYFDGKPTLMGHVCELHRAFGLAIGCDDLQPDGDCQHVQTRLCMCADYVPCGACQNQADEVDDE